MEPITAPIRLELARAYGPAVERLVAVIQELSLARDLPTVMRIVRSAARELTGADGATFVLREDGLCHYADEDAVSPLWKGSRFPMSACISGWAMLNRRSVVIEDIYSDDRIPADAYRPTFVKSLVMVPIRTSDPIGAIGNYWARQRRPTAEEVELLQALADSTSIAMENVQLYAELERRVAQRTAELEAANRDLEAFAHTVSHDLRNPLQAVLGFGQLLEATAAERLDDRGRDHLRQIGVAARRMNALIEDLLRLSQVARAEMHRERVDLSALARGVEQELRQAEPDREVEVRIADGLAADGDPGLLRVVLDNLLRNAWKFTGKVDPARIEFGRQGQQPAGPPCFFVRDNGAGFDAAEAGRLFGTFERLHPAAEFPGTGVGLATVRRVVERHGGRTWAEGQPGRGATFFFTLP